MSANLHISAWACLINANVALNGTDTTEGKLTHAGIWVAMAIIFFICEWVADSRSTK